MKVYEKLNEIKGTDCTAETIADWFYDNRICPCTLDSFVPEVETKFNEWHNLADSVCREREVNCDLECCTNFVNKEIPECDRLNDILDREKRLDISIKQGDCLELMKDIPDKSVDLILTDPPYNIGKAKWDKIPNYIEWCGRWFIECQRVLKDNGSFYWWHNDMVQIAQLMEWLRANSNFVFKQMIVWNKRFEKARNKGFLDGYIVVDGLRNYQQMAEYCLFYTFQDETGLSTVMLDTNNFPTLRGYFKGLQEYIGLGLKTINARLGHRRAEHCFYWKTTQWDTPTPETYQQLIDVFNIDKWEGFREYESLRQEYESLRYTFNNQKTHHSIWEYEVAPKQGHITPKPIEPLEYIIKTSSNPGDTVLDLFMGSGSTGVACVNTNRNFIGFELDKHYYDIAKERIQKALAEKAEGE